MLAHVVRVQDSRRGLYTLSFQRQHQCRTVAKQLLMTPAVTQRLAQIVQIGIELIHSVHDDSK
jgi:hypothetical protein